MRLIETSKVYHDNDAIGSTIAVAFKKSPRLFRDYMDGLQTKLTRPMVLGTNCHMAVLEPRRFALESVVEPDVYHNDKGEPKKWTYTANACKQWRQTQEENGLTVVAPEDAATIKAMHSRMPAEVERIFDAGEAEVTYRTTIRDIACQCRVDWDTPNRWYDFKTISDIDRIETQIAKLQYHIKTAWYSRVISAHLGTKAPPFRLIFAETKAPYRWRIVDLDAEYLYWGNKAVDDTLDGIAACTASGNWSDPEPVEMLVGPPSWMTDEDLMNDEEDAA